MSRGRMSVIVASQAPRTSGLRLEYSGFFLVGVATRYLVASLAQVDERHERVKRINDGAESFVAGGRYAGLREALIGPIVRRHEQAGPIAHAGEDKTEENEACNPEKRTDRIVPGHLGLQSSPVDSQPDGASSLRPGHLVDPPIGNENDEKSLWN